MATAASEAFDTTLSLLNSPYVKPSLIAAATAAAIFATVKISDSYSMPYGSSDYGRAGVYDEIFDKSNYVSCLKQRLGDHANRRKPRVCESM